jgi:hypothetical protein
VSACLCSKAGGEAAIASHEHHDATDFTMDNSSITEPRVIASGKASASEPPLRNEDSSVYSRTTVGGQSKDGKSVDTQLSNNKPLSRSSLASRIVHTQKRSSKFRSFHIGEKKSFNSVMPEKTSGRLPVDTKSFEADANDDDNYVDVDFIMHAGFPDLPKSVPLTFTLTMYACLSRVPEERPTFSQILTLFKDLGEELTSGSYINSVGQPEVCSCVGTMFQKRIYSCSCCST